MSARANGSAASGYPLCLMWGWLRVLLVQPTVSSPLAWGIVVVHWHCIVYFSPRRKQMRASVFILEHQSRVDLGCCSVAWSIFRSCFCGLRAFCWVPAVVLWPKKALQLADGLLCSSGYSWWSSNCFRPPRPICPWPLNTRVAKLPASACFLTMGPHCHRLGRPTPPESLRSCYSHPGTVFTSLTAPYAESAPYADSHVTLPHLISLLFYSFPSHVQRLGFNVSSRFYHMGNDVKPGETCFIWNNNSDHFIKVFLVLTPWICCLSIYESVVFTDFLSNSFIEI